MAGVAGLMAGGLLAGCSEGDATAASESPTASQTPSEAASEPAPVPTETPEWMVNDEDGDPVFAPAGEIRPETDVEGAEQAAEDFLRSYFTGLEEQSSQYMREHSLDRCKYCVARVKEIDNVSGRGYRVEAMGEPVFSNFATITPQPDQRSHVVILDSSIPAIVAKSASGNAVAESPASSAPMAMSMLPTGNRWMVEGVEVLDSERAETLRSTAKLVSNG